jgi:cytochrome c-type biogenesis protein
VEIAVSSFVLGLLATASPCVLPLYPGFLAYLSGQTGTGDAGGRVLLLGVVLLLDRNPFRSLPQVRIPILRRPLLNAYVYGLLYGPIALPCSGPLVVAIFALSISVGEALGKLWVFAWFGLGFGVPLLTLSFLSGTLQHRLTRAFARHSRLINVLSGVLLVGVAVYDLAQNWPMLSAFHS